MSARKLKATIKSVTPLARGFLSVNRYEIDAEKHDGGMRVITWEVMERGHAVAVLGYDPQRDAVVLVNELRPGALVAGDYPYTDNVVAGAIDDQEPAIEAAVREMKEEANLMLEHPTLVHPGAYVSSGGSSEKIAIVVGLVDSTKAGGIHGNTNESEDIQSVVLPAQEFIDRVRHAQITDLKTLVAGYWLAENREHLRSLYAAQS
jgi:ADP-ribose pyrophosphatase